MLRRSVRSVLRAKLGKMTVNGNIWDMGMQIKWKLISIRTRAFDILKETLKIGVEVKK